MSVKYKMKNNVRKEIDKLAEKRLSAIHDNTFPFEIIGCFQDFRSDLSNRNILTEEIEKSDLTHGEKLLMDTDHYLQHPQNVAKFISRYFGTEHIYARNTKTGNGIIFVGQENSIYATSVAFHCLNNIAGAVREKYMKKLKRYKKQSTKDERADERMDEWLEDLIENVRYDSWYDIYDRDLFLDYIKCNFKTYEDERKILCQAVEIIKPMYAPNIDPLLTWGEFKKEVLKIFPEEVINKTIKELDEIQKEDILFFFDEDDFFSGCDDD